MNIAALVDAFEIAAACRLGLRVAHFRAVTCSSFAFRRGTSPHSDLVANKVLLALLKLNELLRFHLCDHAPNTASELAFHFLGDLQPLLFSRTLAFAACQFIESTCGMGRSGLVVIIENFQLF